MPDREKVISWLKELDNFLFTKYGQVPAEEADVWYDRFSAVDYAIALLKEQEAVVHPEPSCEITYITDCCCNLCGVQLIREDKFCRCCGKRIEWEDR